MLASRGSQHFPGPWLALCWGSCWRACEWGSQLSPGRMGNHHLHTCCGLPRNLWVAAPPCSISSMTKLVYFMKWPASLFLGCSSNRSHYLITTMPHFLAFITDTKEKKNLLLSILPFSAALVPLLLGVLSCVRSEPSTSSVEPRAAACLLGSWWRREQSTLLAGRRAY